MFLRSSVTPLPLAGVIRSRCRLSLRFKPGRVKKNHCGTWPGLPANARVVYLKAITVNGITLHDFIVSRI